MASEEQQALTRSAAPGPLGAGYAGLSGEELLRRLARDGRGDVLEAFWRLGNTEVMREVAPYIAALQVPELNALLLDQVLDPDAEDPPGTAVLEAIEEHRPELQPAPVDHLIDRLVDPEPLPAPSENLRAGLELWALRQHGPRVDQFVRAVIAKETPKHDNEHVRNEAVARCQQDAALRQGIYEMLIQRLRADPSKPEWDNASFFLDGVAAEPLGKDGHPALLAQMLTVLAELPSSDTPSSSARTQGSALPVPDNVRVLVHKAAFKRLREILEGQELDTEPPRLALAEMALSVKQPSWREAAIKTLLVHQPVLWEAAWPSSAENWSDEHWRIALQAVLAVAAKLEGSRLSEFIKEAPPSCSDLCMAVALRFAVGELNQLTEAATNVLRLRVEQIHGSDDEELTASSSAFHWPEAPNAAQQAVLQELLTAIPSEQRPAVVVEALRDGEVDPVTAARLLESEGIEAGLAEAEGPDKEQLAHASYEQDPDTTVSAVKTLQSQAFSLELVKALAASDPDIAFSPVEAVWDDLDVATKDALVHLLDVHATKAQSGLLDKIAGDTLKANQDRRRRAVARIAALAETGGGVPARVIEMLQAGNAENRAVGVEGIRAIRPHSLEAVRELRAVAARTDAPGRAAREVLQELAIVYITEVEAGPGRDQRLELLELLGATAQSNGIDLLLEHLGQEAIDDHFEVRLTAAKALREIAAEAEFSAEQQRTVGALLDEEGGEDNGEAREVLEGVLADLTLGPDKALKVLHRLIGFTPKADPDALFGPEKSQLVRHLQLYSKEESRGGGGRDQRFEQLDLISERLLRAAYLRVGKSAKLKEKILAGPKDAQVGEMLQALESVPELQKSRVDLTKVHNLRSEKNEYTHSGASPTPEDETTGLNCFKEGASRLLGVLEERASEPWPV